MLLLMGIFSIYVGLIYNEFLSVPLNLFGSNWEIDPTGDGRHFRLIDEHRTYPFGVDPVWKVCAGVYFDRDKQWWFKVMKPTFILTPLVLDGIFTDLVDETDTVY